MVLFHFRGAAAVVRCRCATRVPGGQVQATFAHKRLAHAKHGGKSSPSQACHLQHVHSLSLNTSCCLSLVVMFVNPVCVVTCFIPPWEDDTLSTWTTSERLFALVALSCSHSVSCVRRATRDVMMHRFWHWAGTIFSTQQWADGG